ncbi:MAG: gliding motility protein GldM [Polaribacter sp.]|jgi:gliding motility-associated protein GldM|nr:gliding motility protein GldM [Polaribacter sp.]MDG1953844.1 gliding motility protein GldM [Polaribacter sp.]
MAGGKMSPRQKMINLMYLVFIAMLAMNMSKEVLSAFGFMNEGISENNTTTTQKNNAAYLSLSSKATDQPAEYGPLNQQALEIKGVAENFYSYLDNLKSKMTEGIEDDKAYQSMDKTDFLDSYFFLGDGFTAEGDDFLAKIASFRDGIKAALGNNETLKSTVDRRFNTDVQLDADNKEIPWLKYRYEGFPLIASIANLTQMQSNIKNTESDILTTLLGGKLESEVSLSNYKGIVQLDKTAYYVGEKVTGKVVLGRYDANMKPDKVTLNGRNYTNVKSGQVILDFRANKLGDNDIKGVISFTENGKSVPVAFNSSYTVIPEPNDAVISADAMNVVYRGVDNPVSVSLPGVSNNNLNVSATGGLIAKSGSSYLLKPGKGNEMKVNVSATLSSGKKVNSPKKFRIKDIPPAMGTARGGFGIVKMPKTSVGRVTIGAGLQDFVFDLKLKVTKFSVKVPGQLAVTVNGTTFNAAAKKAIGRARRGQQITIFDIEAVIENNTSYKLKKVMPVIIEISN